MKDLQEILAALVAVKAQIYPAVCLRIAAGETKGSVRAQEIQALTLEVKARVPSLGDDIFVVESRAKAIAKALWEKLYSVDTQYKPEPLPHPLPRKPVPAKGKGKKRGSHRHPKLVKVIPSSERIARVGRQTARRSVPAWVLRQAERAHRGDPVD